MPTEDQAPMKIAPVDDDITGPLKSNLARAAAAADGAARLPCPKVRA
jgi:hypothetical protein